MGCLAHQYDGVCWKILWIFSISSRKTAPFWSPKSTFTSVWAALQPSFVLASRGLAACERKGNLATKKKGSCSPGKCERYLESYVSLRTKIQQSRNLTSVLTESPPSSSLCSTSRRKTATQLMAWIIHRRVEIDHTGYPCVSSNSNWPHIHQ